MLSFLSSIYFAFLGSYCVLAMAYCDRSLRQSVDYLFFLISAFLAFVCAIESIVLTRLPTRKSLI